MTEHTQKHIKSSQKRRWPWFLLPAFVVLLLTVRLCLNTDFVRRIVKDQVVSTVNEQLTVALAIDELKGDLWKEVILQGVSVTDTDTLATIDSIRVHYNILSYFKSVFEIPEITISKPFVKLRQQDSVLNVTDWIRVSLQDSAGSEPFPVRIDHFSIHDGKIDALIDALSPDSAFAVDNIRLHSSFALLEEGYEANISGFSFDILQTRLNETISFESTLHAEKHTISLEKLVIATGHSVLQSSGRLNTQDATTDIDFQARPLAWRDIAAYVNRYPIQQNLELQLHIKGNANQFHVGLGVDATGVDELELGADLAWDSTLHITQARLSANQLNLAGFLGDTALPVIQNLQLKANGNVPVQSYKNGSLEGTFATGSIRYRSYLLDVVNAAFSLSDGNVKAEVSTRRQQQEVKAELSINEVWSPQPGVEFTANGRDINPGYWIEDDRYKGDLAFSAKISGKGFLPGESPWSYRLIFDKGEFFQQSFNRLSLKGTLNKHTITNETLFRLRESEVTFNARVENYQTIPRFSYKLRTGNFDLSECRNLEDFTSAISVTIGGKGRGASLETLELTSSIRMDSSVVNEEYIDRLVADVSVKDTVATVKPAELQSTIADGSFDARLHLYKWYDTGNELNLDLEIKDIRSLAPLANIEELSAEGTIAGNLSPIYDENLKFTGDVILKNMIYNEQFNARQASGKVEVLVAEDPEFVVSLDLVSPAFSAVQLQDLYVQTRGKVSERTVDGNFNLHFSGPNESEIVHSGRYNFAADSSVITTESYELTTSLRTLSLENPFRLVLKNQSIRMDTMRLSSGESAILELAIPYADSVRQEGYLVGEDLNMTAIQNTLLSESYFEGILSGNLTVANSDSAFEASGKLLLSGLNYQGTSLDSLKLELDVGSNQLKGNLEVIDRGDQLMAGEVNLPFRLGNPRQFDDTFFDKPVNGYLKMKRVALSRFDTLLSLLGIVDTKGMLRLNADLEGTAGEPLLTGNLALDSATISGVKVDSITARLQYIHELSKLSLTATVNSLKQRAAEIKAEVPFYVDLKNGEIFLPGKKDSISVDVATNNFNLAAFNDFVNREQVRNIKGRVNGMVHVKGMISELETEGELNFTEGSVRIVKTGITVDGMRGTLFFEPDLLTIRNFRAKSGSGSINMNGRIGFEELIPGDVDATLKANNFKVANTSQYNAVIDLDTRMTGSFSRLNISGSLSVLNGFIQLDNFGEKSVEDVRLDSSVRPDYKVAVYDSLDLDLDVSFNRRFFIRNQRYLDMQVALDGSVDMLKDAGKELQIFGALETVNGYARPLGKRFELEEGVITFTGDASNPELNIRTLYEPPQPEEKIMIWYIIEGRVENPMFKYESSPPMELEDILCYTLFGQPCFALESWKRAVASSGSNSSAADLALEVLMDRIESLATQRLGIDVVKIDNTSIGGESGTSITTGWYVNPKVFFAIQNVITGSIPDTSFLLEYLLQKNLKLIISQGNDSRQGIDLKWNYDY